MNKISNSFTSIEQVASQYLNQPQKNTNLQVEKNGLSVEEILKQCMENAIKLSVPLEVEVSCAHNWYDLK